MRRFSDAKPPVDPLLLTGAFVLDFLMRPSLDGNGPMARLLTTLPLTREISRSAIHQHRTVGREDQPSRFLGGLARDGRHSLEPWWDYFLGLVLAQSQFAEPGPTLGKRSKSERVRLAIDQLPDVFSIAEVERLSPGERPTIRLVMQSLRSKGADLGAESRQEREVAAIEEGGIE